MYLTGIIKDCQFREIIFPLLAVLVGLEQYPDYQDEKIFDYLQRIHTVGIVQGARSFRISNLLASRLLMICSLIGSHLIF